MKRLIALFLCICLIMTGCHSKTDNNNKNLSPTNNPSVTGGEENQDEEKDNNTGIVSSLLKLNSEWSSATTVGLKQQTYTDAGYTAKAAPYTIAKDLSNIENIGQFSGFTREQKNMLVKNGFVVLPGQDTRVYYVYDENQYLGVPNFITSDSVLHMYHQFYDKSLAFIESDSMYRSLDQMTKDMLENSAALYKELKDEKLKALQEKNIVYFLVGRMLFLNSEAAGIDVGSDLLELAKEEYALIGKAEGYARSPLLDKDFDYSQFTVRGHYTRSDELGRYFKTMMWFGTFPLPLVDENKEVNYDNTLQALLISFTTFLDNGGTCDAKLWSDIYLPTGQYVGQSDDINVFTMNGLRLSVFGDSNDPNTFNDSNYHDKLIEGVKALPEPKIQADMVFSSTPTGKQFRFMGQRYVLDSYILQELTDSLKRPVASPLDVCGVLGNTLAEDMIFNGLQPQKAWPEYEMRYHKLKEEVGAYPAQLWGSNLYNGWLWALQEAMRDFESASGMPFFMTTDAWKYKSLDTALGSYTELKHDTVLYGKQAVAEAGDVYETADQQYVEPNIELYRKLYYLTDFTLQVLKDRGMSNDEILRAANEYKDLLSFLITCSEKELRNEPLTQDEIKELLYYGGTLESIAMSLLLGLSGDYDSKEISDILVTDIASCNGEYLSLGTGFFDQIYVVVPVDGKLYLSRGSVYSYYEFMSDKRLTDEQWWELQGITINHEEYGDYVGIITQNKNCPDQPSWVKNFKSPGNHVAIQPLEINWEEYE